MQIPLGRSLNLTIAFIAIIVFSVPAMSQVQRPPVKPADAEVRESLRQAAAEAMKHPAGQLQPGTPYLIWRDTTLSIALAQLAAGDREGAKASLISAAKAYLEVENLDTDALLQTATAMIDGGFPAEARQPLRAAVPIVIKEWRNEKKRGQTLAPKILQAQVRSGDQEGANATLALIEKRTAGSTPYVSNDVVDIYDYYNRIRAWTACGREEQAFQEIEKFCVGDEADPKVAVLLLSLMAEAVQCRASNEGRPVLERIRKQIDDLQLKPEAAADARASLSLSLALFGEIQEAHAVANTIPGSIKSNTMLRLAVIAGEHGDAVSAINDLRTSCKILEAFDDKQVSGAWQSTVNVQARFGDGAGVRTSLAHVGKEWWVQILVDLATSERARGDETAATQSIAEAQKAARLGLDERLRSTTDDKLIAEIERIGAKIEKPQVLTWGLVRLALVQAASGDLDSARIAVEAVAHVPKLNNPEYHLANRQYHLAKGRANFGDLKGAITDGLALKVPLERQKALEGAAHGFVEWKNAQKLR